MFYSFQFPGLLRGPTRLTATTIGSLAFQFPGLLRGPTSGRKPVRNDKAISIPRPLARPDLRPVGIGNSIREFQFPGLLRGPTYLFSFTISAYRISIPRPLARPDHFPGSWPAHSCHFNSQASCEARQKSELILLEISRFQFPGLLRGPTPARP